MVRFQKELSCPEVASLKQVSGIKGNCSMVLFLLALLVGLTTFILILAVRDLSPLKAFYKAARKITGINFEPQPLPMDSPFSRPSTHIAGRHGLHRPVLLNLETYEGTGQGCHPDVLYIAEGFGAGRWRYWMA